MKFNNNFLKLWVGQLISSFGDRFTQMAILALVVLDFQKQISKVAFITFLGILPFLLFSQIFGVLADRLNKKVIMAFSDLLRAILVLLIPFILLKFSSIFVLYGIVFVLSTFSALFIPAKMALLPIIVKKENLLKANALIAGCSMSATLLGTFIAGYIIDKLGVYVSFYINSFTYVISFILIFFIVVSKDRLNLSHQKITLNIFIKDLKNGFSQIYRHQLLFRLMQLNFIFSFLAGCFYITVIDYSLEHFVHKAITYSVLLSVLGLGLLMGSLILLIMKHRYIHTLIIGFVLVSLGSFGFLFSPSFLISNLLLILVGMGGAFIIVTLDSLLQRVVFEDIRANVLGVRGILYNLGLLLGILLGGYLSSYLNSVYIFFIISLISGLLSWLIFVSLGPLGYRILRSLIRLFLRIFFELKIEGIENVGNRKRVIFAGNHTSVLDGLILISAYPERVYFLAAESLFRTKPWGWIARQLGFIPVKRNTINRDAIREAIRILLSGYAIGIFPEGRITENGKITEFKQGTAFIAQKTNTPIVPFAIEGAYFAWPVWQKYPRPHPIKIKFGSPIYVNEYKLSEELTFVLMEDIKKIKKDLETEILTEVDPNVIVKHFINFR